MRNTHPLDIASLLSLLVGLSSIALDAAFQSNLTALFGSYSPKIVAGMGLAGLLASQVLRVIGAPSGTVVQASYVVPSPSDGVKPIITGTLPPQAS